MVLINQFLRPQQQQHLKHVINYNSKWFKCSPTDELIMHMVLKTVHCALMRLISYQMTIAMLARDQIVGGLAAIVQAVLQALVELYTF